nr:hypothetical protein [uncultured Carboxylicivirga sp.]
MTIGNIANVMAQNEQDSTEVYKIADPVSLGLGFGQDYGGLGANFLVYPQDNIGFFFGGGYAIAGFGYNVGAKIRFFSKTNPRTNFFITGMYGYNAAIKVQNASEFDKLFYGPTIGFGLDTGKRSYRNGYWSFALLIPFRSSAVQDYFDDLEDNHGVQFENELLPISFSIGYRFRLN